MSRYRASPPLNTLTTDPSVYAKWGVWDSVEARFASKNEYAESFAKILAAAMNRAYATGVQDGKRENGR